MLSDRHFEFVILSALIGAITAFVDAIIQAIPRSGDLSLVNWSNVLVLGLVAFVGALLPSLKALYTDVPGTVAVPAEPVAPANVQRIDRAG